MFCNGLVLFLCVCLVYKFLDWLIRIPLASRKIRHIFVTGCDTGFGFEIAKRLDKKGLYIFAGCLTEQGEKDLREQCSSRLKTVRLNITDPTSVRKAYSIVKDSLPPGQGLWGILNNAGIGGRFGPLTWMEIADFKEAFAVNVYGLIDVTITFLPLIKKGRGRVVNTASIYGRLSEGSPYSCSKYAVEAFSDGLRRELYEFGVSVHLIEPGFHNTHLTSPAMVNRGYTSSWHKLSPQLKEEYGEQYYRDCTTLVVNKYVGMLASEGIDDVVDAYEHALIGMFPRARYVVGKDAKFLWLPIQWLPEWLGDYVLRYIKKNNPRPACLKI